MKPTLSVVTMLYRSEGTVRGFYERTSSAAGRLGLEYEIVFVDDGSPDRAADVVREIQRDDPRVVLVQLSRNFGHHQAAVAGLGQARGERIFIIDVDLEESPEWLVDFWVEMERSRADVVYGVAALRTGGLFKRWSGALFWWGFNRLSETPVPGNPCTVRLMSRRYVDALLTLPDRNLFLAGNYAWLGFPQVGVSVNKGRRPGRSSYTLGRMLRLFLDAVTSFTSYPLRLIFMIGAAIAALSGFTGSALIVRKVVAPESISLGWPSVIVSIWFLGGTIIAFLGVIGIYLSKVFNETKGRPLFVIRSVERRDGL